MPADIKKKMLERTVIGIMALRKQAIAFETGAEDRLLAQLEADEAKRTKIKGRLEARTQLMLSRQPVAARPARAAVAA